jgi:hypothetical protein
LDRFWVSKYDRLTYHSFNRLILKIPNNAVLIELSNQISYNEILIDEIVLITKGEDYTYDLHVPETNSFISNGIVSHNTGEKPRLSQHLKVWILCILKHMTKKVKQFQHC